MKQRSKRLISLLVVVTMVCAMLTTAALAVPADPTDTITITVNVFDRLTNTMHKNVGTDTVARGNNHVVSEQYQIPELSKFTEEKYGSVVRVIGNWHGSSAHCNVGSKVAFSCDIDSAHITYWVNGFGSTGQYTIRYYDGADKVNEGTVVMGKSTTTMGALTKEGFEFKGWSTTDGGTVDYGADTQITPIGDMTLYAVWEAKALPGHTCEDKDDDGYCDDDDCDDDDCDDDDCDDDDCDDDDCDDDTCHKCLHDHDGEGYCTVDGCAHPHEGDDACCPKPSTGGNPTGKVSEPGMDKKADGKESIGVVRPGQKIAFTLQSTVPQKLAELGRQELDRWKLKGEYRLVFHDTLSGNLTLDTSSITVKIGKATVDARYYTVATQGLGSETFTVTVDLVAAFNEGHYFTREEIGTAEVVVSYSATVAANAADGDAVKNEAYVNNSKVDAVVGEVDIPDTPATGGTGTVLYTISGLGLMSTAAVLLILRRKQGTD